MAAPKLPKNFGPYTLQELIARGGMAEIFRATTSGVGGFEKTVAIKKILPHLAENDEYMTMLIDEARIIVSINHANIAQVYDLGEIDGDYYIAMEYIHGIDLSTMVKELKDSNRTVPVEHALFIASGIAAGLHVAHNKCDETGRPINIVHRDVSPHNILISFAGDVKIIDFGVAKARGKEAHTQLGVIKGKLLYMAPEQAMAKELDGRADLFAMGLILYRLLTNHLPFEGDNEFQIYNHILSKEITPPRAFNPDIPEEVNQIVMMLLQRDPSKRYQDGYSAKVDLDRALQAVAPGYSISRLSRWVEDNFSHLIAKRRQAQSGQNDAPSTPSHNHVGTGELEQPGWSADWDDVDEDEDTINVSMDSPEAQEVLERAQRERAQYQELRASGAIAAPAAAPWANQPQQGQTAGQVPQPQQSGQWAQPQGYQQPGPYGSGQHQAPMQSGQYAAPYGSEQYPVPGQAGQGPNHSGLFAGYPSQSGQYPVNQSGQYPVNQSGQYPVNQSGQFPVNQSGLYPLPNSSGQYAAASPHYQTFQGPSPHRDASSDSGQAVTASSGASLRAKVIVLVVLVIVVALLGWNYVSSNGSEAGPETNLPPQETNPIAVPPEGTTTGVASVEEPVAAADAGSAEVVLTGDAGPGVRMVGFRIDTLPEGADVYVNDRLVGQTPIRDQIAWGEKEVTLRFELAGYQTQEMAAIPFDNMKRKVELRAVSAAPDAGSSADAGQDSDAAGTGAAEKVEEAKPKPKPKRKKKRRKRRRKPKADPPKKEEAAVPLLLDMEEKKDKPPAADVPVF